MMSDKYIYDTDRVAELIEQYRVEFSGQNDPQRKEEIKDRLHEETLGLITETTPDGHRIDELSDDELIKKFVYCRDENGKLENSFLASHLESELIARGCLSDAWDVVEEHVEQA